MEIINEIQDSYSIYTNKAIIIDLRFNDIDEVNASLSNLQNKIIFYDDEFHYQDNYSALDIMLKVTLYIEADSNTEVFEVFYEID